MKKLWLLTLWCVPLFGIPCHYDGSDFVVTWQGKELRQAVAKNFSEARWSCGSKLAALYDGGDFVVFEGGTFRSRKANHGYESALVRTHGQWAGLYDGDRVWAYGEDKKFFDESAHSYAYAQIVMAPGRLGIYDGSVLWDFNGTRWESQKVRAEYRHTRLEASGQFVVFYDGDDLWVWERGKSQPDSTAVKYQFYFPVVLVGDAALGFYDGARLHGYCSGKGWSKDKTSFDAFASGVLQKSGNIEIQVAGHVHALDATSCQWTKRKAN